MGFFQLLISVRESHDDGFTADALPDRSPRRRTYILKYAVKITALNVFALFKKKIDEDIALKQSSAI